jgi:hypothetical protein
MPSWTRAPPESLMKTNGRAGLQRGLHHLDDLDAVHLAGGAAHDGEVLAGDVDRDAHHRAPVPVTTPSAGMSALSMPKVVRPVAADSADLLEGAVIQERVDALTRGQLALARAASDAAPPPPPSAPDAAH